MKHLAAFLFLASAHGAASQWEHTGPFGAWTNCHLNLGGVDLVGGTAGIFKSTDGAQTWAPFGSGLPDGGITKLFHDGSVLYTAVDQEGLFRSLDDGMTWSACNNANMGYPYDINAISGDATELLVACNEGRYRSTDQGLSFTALGTTPNYPGEMIPLGGNTIVSRGGFNYPGYLYRSTDNGATWQEANTGLPTLPEIGALYAEAGDVYAFGKHVYRSTDQGITWVQQTVAPGLYSPQFSCRSGDTFYFSTGGNLGVAVSRWDMGATAYIDITSGLPDTWTTTVFATPNGNAFINKNGTLYQSTDQGETWIEQSSTGMIGVQASSVLAENNLVLCGAYEGIHRSVDDGATWQRVASPEYATITAFYKNGSTVLAATDGSGILRSTDDGLTWPGSALTNLSIGGFADAGGALFAGGSNAGNATVQRSTDGGSIWSDFSTGLPAQAGVLDLIVIGSDLFAGIGAGIDSDPGVYRSSTNSANWMHLPTGIENLAGTAFAFNSGYVYLGTENGVYRSDDMGNSWSAIGPSLAGVRVNDLAVVGNNVVAATESGIFLLAPSASDWSDITNDLQPAEPLALATGIGNAYLYAATSGRSVARRNLVTVGVMETSSVPGLTIAPNPIDRFFTITGDGITPGARIVVSDALGREAPMPCIVRGNSIAADAGALSAGAYMLSIVTQGTLRSTRIVKQ